MSSNGTRQTKEGSMMTDDSRALAPRPNGNGTATDIDPEKTRAVWASAGTTNLTEPVVRALSLISRRYNLDPALGEIMIMGNRPYITADGMLRIADEHPMYDGYQLRICTPEERKGLKVGDDEHAYVCHVVRKDRKFPFVGWGIASERTVQAGPLKAFVREIAQKRAVHRALRAAFRAGLPDFEELEERLSTMGPIEVEVSDPPPMLDAPPPALPEPDWKSFWPQMKSYGLDRAEVYRILGVKSIRDEWKGSLADAIAAVDRYVLQRDTPAPPDDDQGRGWTREQRIDEYRKVADTADQLGVPIDILDPRWSDEDLGKRIAAGHQANRSKEAMLALGWEEKEGSSR